MRAVVCTLHAIFGTSLARQLSGTYLLNLVAIVASFLFVLWLDNLNISDIVVVEQRTFPLVRHEERLYFETSHLLFLLL